MTPIAYILHSGNLYGTERMALATMTGLGQQGIGLLLAPPGPVHAEARALGIDSQIFRSSGELLRQLIPVLRQHSKLHLIATGVSHSLLAHALAMLFRCQLRHIHVVHGGTDERLSYGRKSLLNHLPVTLVAVSDFVRERLLAHGCRADRICVVENFLPCTRLAPRRSSQISSIRRVAVVSRLDPIKRVGLLLDAIQRRPELKSLQFEVFGEGSEFEALKQRTMAFDNVILHGFQSDVASRMAEFDLLLHTCAEEPFGLAILEAMDSGIPVLVPNAGGAGALVENERTGFHFPANCSGGLANRLESIVQATQLTLAAMTTAAYHEMQTRFSPARGLRQYADLLAEVNHA
ncbi:MAG: glycosyltransferase family 4 protein [Pseudohongiella sp.]|nr:glycosyltransferase family 4 protein [Pseudohongiella sp.]